MRLATAELRRRPRPFVLLAGGLTVLTLLVGLLGGLAQGLTDGFSGALRAQGGDLVVYSTAANDSVVRSRITGEDRAAVEAVDGVRAVRGLGISLVGARPAGTDRRDAGGVIDVAVVGYESELARVPAPPGAGEGLADERLREDGVGPGDVLEVGPAGTPVAVVGFVADTSYLLNGGLWVEPGTWRAIQADARPDAAPPPGGFQALAVDLEPGADPAAVAARVDRATGTTTTRTAAGAVAAIPGLAESAGTLDAVGYVALLVVVLVAALFFSLTTVERLPLLAVLRALGAPSRRLAAAVVAQALACGAAAVTLGVGLTLAIAATAPASTPIALPAGRVAAVFLGIEAACLLGALAAVVRLRRLDPAAAIGTATPA
jgi:putative ABC transport system permease protein